MSQWNAESSVLLHEICEDLIHTEDVSLWLMLYYNVFILREHLNGLLDGFRKDFDLLS